MNYRHMEGDVIKKQKIDENFQRKYKLINTIKIPKGVRIGEKERTRQQ